MLSYDAEDPDGAETLDTDDRERRLALYHEAWSACRARIDGIVAQQHEASLGELEAFVRGDADRKDVVAPVYIAGHPLPTGLVLGASPSTAPTLAARLAPDHLVARLAGRECTSLKVALRCMIGRFMPAPGAERKQMKGRKMSMLAPDDMALLEAWYKSLETRPTLVVHFEDFESFNPRVVADLVHVLSRYRARLPLVLMLNLGTSAAALTPLGHATIALLRVATFNVEAGGTMLDAIVRGVFVDWHAPLSIGLAAYDLLRETFDDHVHSIDAVISTIQVRVRTSNSQLTAQLMYLDHFMGSPLALLTLERKGKQRALDVDIDDLLVDRSFRDALTELDAAQQARILDGEDDVLELVETARERHRTAATHRRDALALLIALQSSFATGARDLPDLLRAVFAGTLLADAKTSSDNLRRGRDDVLQAFLAAAMTALPEGEARDRMAMRSAELEAILGGFDRRAAGRQHLINGNEHRVARIKLTALDEQFTELIKTVADELASYFESGLTSYASLPFHAIWHYGNPESVRKVRGPPCVAGSDRTGPAYAALAIVARLARPADDPRPAYRTRARPLRRSEAPAGGRQSRQPARLVLDVRGQPAGAILGGQSEQGEGQAQGDGGRARGCGAEGTTRPGALRRRRQRSRLPGRHRANQAQGRACSPRRLVIAAAIVNSSNSAPWSRFADASHCSNMAVRASWTLHHESAPTTGSLEIAPPTNDLNGLRIALEDARKQLNGASIAPFRQR